MSEENDTALERKTREKKASIVVSQQAREWRQSKEGPPKPGGSDQEKEKRQMITRKIFIALFIAAMTTITAFAQTNNPPAWTSPTGSWEGVVTTIGPGPAPFRVLMNFTADGGFIGSGDGDAAASPSGSPQFGVWERVGSRNSRTYAVTFRQIFYNPDSSSAGSARMQQTVILNDTGDTWTGPFVVRIYAPDGTLVFTSSGTATATRIASEPLP